MELSRAHAARAAGAGGEAAIAFSFDEPFVLAFEIGVEFSFQFGEMSDQSFGEGLVFVDAVVDDLFQLGWSV